jgi:hypothetical protein
MWNGFFITNKKTHIFKRLAIQFSETDPELGAFAFCSSPVAIAVEGCCLYGPSPLSSTPIEKFFQRVCVLPRNYRKH